MEKNTAKKGVSLKVVGFSLAAVGGLNSMLALKSGAGQDAFNYLLIISGVLSFAAGIWRSGVKTLS